MNEPSAAYIQIHSRKGPCEWQQHYEPRLDYWSGSILFAVYMGESFQDFEADFPQNAELGR